MAETGLTYSEALEAMKKGNRVQREGWNGAGMHAYLEEGLTKPIRAGVAAGTVREYEPFFVLFNAQRKHQPGWALSPADQMATDWRIVD